jgi:hypothetical protein
MLVGSLFLEILQALSFVELYFFSAKTSCLKIGLVKAKCFAILLSITVAAQRWIFTRLPQTFYVYLFLYEFLINLSRTTVV